MSRALNLLGAAVALGMLVLGVVILLNARDDAWRQAEQASSNLSIALERDIARNIASYDLSISGAINSLRIPGIDQASPALRHAAVFDSSTSAAYLGSLLVADAAGNVVMDSQSLIPHAVNVGDREHFRVQKERPDVGLYIGRPVRSRLDNDPIIALSRRFNDADGHFAGAVIGGMRLAYFQDLFAKLYFGVNGTVTLLRADGRVLARYPYREADIDTDISKVAIFKTISAAPFGQFVGYTAADGVNRLYTFRHVGDLPLILNIGISVDEIYAPWRHKAIIIGSILVGLCAGTLLLCQLFRREMQRRVVAETDLRKAAEELSTLATTDGLTGLDNRRSFDARFAQEWRRATRTRASLCLLMIDADCFKLYNDAHGHQGGDRVLQGIAGSIRHNIRGAYDIAARYGGEEFVVVLPETELGGGLQVAERIRAAVANLAIAHDGSPSGRVTISIGLASRRPMPAEPPEELLRHADEALFAAKQRGRNQVCLAVPDAATTAAVE